MTQQLNVIDRAAERLAGASAGLKRADERERTVSLEAGTFGMELSNLICWIGAVLLAVTGQIGAPIALIVAPLIPALGTAWYAKRRHVSSYAVLSRTPLRWTLAWTATLAALMFSAVAALVYRLYFGEGLIPFSMKVEVVGEGLQQAMAISALVGAGLGVIVALGLMSLIVRRQRRKAQREEANPVLD